MADLFDVVVARKLSGGGGSSDFSTARVDIVGGDVAISAAICVEDGTDAWYEGSDGDWVDVILYNGSAYAAITGGTISTSGDITHIVGDAYSITGNCTITIS